MAAFCWAHVLAAPLAMAGSSAVVLLSGTVPPSAGFSFNTTRESRESNILDFTIETNFPAGVEVMLAYTADPRFGAPSRLDAQALGLIAPAAGPAAQTAYFPVPYDVYSGGQRLDFKSGLVDLTNGHSNGSALNVRIAYRQVQSDGIGEALAGMLRRTPALNVRIAYHPEQSGGIGEALAGMLRRTAAGNGRASNGNGRYHPEQSDGIGEARAGMLLRTAASNGRASNGNGRYHPEQSGGIGEALAGMLRRTAAGNGRASNGNGRYQPGQSGGIGEALAGMLRRTAAANGGASNGNGRYQPEQSDGNREARVAVAGELPAGNGNGRALGRIAPAAGTRFPPLARTLTLTLVAA